MKRKINYKLDKEHRQDLLVMLYYLFGSMVCLLMFMNGGYLMEWFMDWIMGFFIGLLVLLSVVGVIFIIWGYFKSR